MSAFQLCNVAGTLLLMCTAASTSAIAQFGDAGASELVQKAKKALPDKRADAERLLKEALAVPGQTQSGYGQIAMLLAAFLIGEQRPASEIRPLAQKALQLYTQAAAEKSNTALALEILSSVPDPGADPGEAVAMSAQAKALRSQIIEDLQAQTRAGSVFPETPPYRIGQGLTAPVPRERPEPSYTDPARLARRQGAVLVSIVIDEQGKARNLKIVRGLGFGLDESAYDAISRWQFEPALLNGVPVSVTANVELNFRLL